MTESEIKAISKFLIENGYRNINDIEKELLKKAVDESHNWQELMSVAIISRMLG